QQAPAAAPTAEVELWRLDCGTMRDAPLAAFSDTFAYPDRRQDLAVSCYLIRHGQDYMIWDMGIGPAQAAEWGAELPRTVREQLAEVGVAPERIGRVGISHFHGDHSGQLPDFPAATLVIGAGDWAAITATPPDPRIQTAPFAHWMSGGGRVEPADGDVDVFGDGSVVVLDLPGHTPGHHGLLVRLAGMGPVLLTGDLAHFTDNYVSDGVPTFNTDRAHTLASLDRFKRIAENLRATVIIQHEIADVGKLPAFPESAR
ncbi:MAG: N-acyl homoserine lactonase family protein, partial [Sphingomonadaceae bacterium]|nr:N-acyl homoserine lactonase family protein [Sphingomonadaceae bacterium]